MEVKISENEQPPFNGIRISVEGLKKTGEVGAKPSVNQSTGKMPDVEGYSPLTEETIDDDTEPTYD